MKSNWQIKKLGEVCDFEGGSQPPKSNFIHEPRKGYVRFLQIRDFASNKYITYIPDSKKNRHCDVEDILLGRYGASVGKILVNKKGAYNVAVMKTMPNPEMVDKSYFYYYLISDEFQKPLSKVAARSAQAGFSKDDIYDFPVLTPPIPRQKRIVKILDEVFENVEKAKENAEKNLKNSKELFESYLQSVFANPGKDWEEKSLEELGQITSSKRIYKKEYAKAGVPFYRIKEIKELAHEKNITIELYISKKRYKEIKDVFGVPVVGDILMTAVGTIGEIYVVKNNGEFYFKDGNVLWFKDFNSVDPNFLKFVLMSFVEQIKKLSKGSAYSALTIEKIEKHKIFLPPLSEQKAIVKKLDEFSKQTKKLEAIYKQKLADLEELKKSVLRRAFNGNL
ncbi:MAG: restriction endonuclease subunit S [bacterium]